VCKYAFFHDPPQQSLLLVLEISFAFSPYFFRFRRFRLPVLRLSQLVRSKALGSFLSGFDFFFCAYFFSNIHCVDWPTRWSTFGSTPAPLADETSLGTSPHCQRSVTFLHSCPRTFSNPFWLPFFSKSVNMRLVLSYCDVSSSFTLSFFFFRCCLADTFFPLSPPLSQGKLFASIDSAKPTHENYLPGPPPLRILPRSFACGFFVAHFLKGKTSRRPTPTVLTPLSLPLSL